MVLTAIVDGTARSPRVRLGITVGVHVGAAALAFGYWLHLGGRCWSTDSGACEVGFSTSLYTAGLLVLVTLLSLAVAMAVVRPALERRERRRMWARLVIAVWLLGWVQWFGLSTNDGENSRAVARACLFANAFDLALLAAVCWPAIQLARRGHHDAP